MVRATDPYRGCEGGSRWCLALAGTRPLISACTSQERERSLCHPDHRDLKNTITNRFPTSFLPPASLRCCLFIFLVSSVSPGFTATREQEPRLLCPVRTPRAWSAASACRALSKH